MVRWASDATDVILRERSPPKIHCKGTPGPVPLRVMDRETNAESGWTSGYDHGVSTVPERFRSTSTPHPGQSLVPPEFSSTSAPAEPAPDPSLLYR